MDDDTTRAVTDALDYAIAQSAEDELKRLCHKHGRQETARQIVDALHSMKRLAEGGKPKYDEWDAIFYVLWYQPGQINLAYTLARALLEKTRGGELSLRLAGDQHLHVDDFGCGAWAMQFGLALAIADLRGPSQEFPRVTVNPEDESQPMWKLGKSIWENFHSLSQGDVEDICRRIEIADSRPIFAKNSESWVTALHAVYDQDSHSFQKVIARMAEIASPDCILLTSHYKKKDSLDFGIIWYVQKPLVIPVNLAISGDNFEECDTLRRRIKDFLEESSASIDSRYLNIAIDYLERAPSWVHNLNKSTGKIFRRRKDVPAQAVSMSRASESPTPHPDAIGQATADYAPATQILQKATGFMDAYDYTLNPYSGCSFGCTYCYAAFFSRTAEERESWGRWVRVKENADALLKKAKRRLKGKTIYMSTVTDPYQPIERQLELTRGLLEIMANHTPRLVVQTRSPLVTRDIDLFHAIERNGGRVQVNMTVTTDDEDVRKAFEPWCPSNANRLDAICEVAEAGVQTCITMTPLLLVNDPDRFASDLLATGVPRFIIQTFHFEKGKFTASTREEAIEIMSARLGCEPAAFRREYTAHYDRVHATLKERLPRLGEGKDGFKPPFEAPSPDDPPGPIFHSARP